jgi:hypothetical protein
MAQSPSFHEGHSVCSLAEKRFVQVERFGSKCFGGPTPIFLLNLELDGRSAWTWWVGACLLACFPPSLSILPLFVWTCWDSFFLSSNLRTYMYPNKTFSFLIRLVPSSPNISDKAIRQRISQWHGSFDKAIRQRISQ